MIKNKYTENLGLKIMAVLFAVVLWLIVVNVDDPVQTVTFRNVPVTMVNTEIVTNKGKTYKVLDDSQTANVVVKAKRSVVSKITSDKIVATADMSGMQFESLVPITVNIPGFEGNYTAEAAPANLKVTIEERTKKVFPVTVAASGTPRDGYVVSYNELTPNPEKITVRGSKSVVSSIDVVVAKVDVSGISKSGEIPAELVFYDSNGNPINRSQLTDNVGEDGITVNVTVLNTKNVGLEFSASGQPAEGYAVTNITYEPETIQVCGSEEDLKNLTKLVIPSDEIDVSGASQKIETTVDVSQYLPEGIQLVDEKANNVVVTVTREEAGTRTIEIQPESIKIKNLARGLKVSFEEDSDIELQFRGPKESLDALNISDATSIDMKEFTTTGTYEVPVEVDLGASSAVTLEKNPIIKVTLTVKDHKPVITENPKPKE